MIIDEIDAHLHPTAQQRIMPILRRHFPRMQIFCSTHSPLMLVASSLGKSSFSSVTAMAQSPCRAMLQLSLVSLQMLLRQFFRIPLATVSPQGTPTPTRDRRSARARTTSQATPAYRAPRTGTMALVSVRSRRRAR
jgi:hypothetical protein